MHVIQKMIGVGNLRIPCTLRPMNGIVNGFQKGDNLMVFQKGDILYFTKKEPPKGFTFLKGAKVWFTQNKNFIGVPKEWQEEYIETKYVKMIYAENGIFVRPAKGEDFGRYLY